MHKLFEFQDEALMNKYAEYDRTKDVAGHAAEYKDLDEKIESKKEQIVLYEKEIMKSFSSMMVESMVNFVSSEILGKMVDFDYEDKGGVPEMTAASVDFIINRGKCICGRSLEDNPDCLTELKELRTFLPPESIGAQIRHFTNDLSGLSTESSRKDVFNAHCTSY